MLRNHVYKKPKNVSTIHKFIFHDFKNLTTFFNQIHHFAKLNEYFSKIFLCCDRHWTV